jgi:hypothetical protein
MTEQELRVAANFALGAIYDQNGNFRGREGEDEVIEILVKELKSELSE